MKVVFQSQALFVIGWSRAIDRSRALVQTFLVDVTVVLPLLIKRMSNLLNWTRASSTTGLFLKLHTLNSMHKRCLAYQNLISKRQFSSSLPPRSPSTDPGFILYDRIADLSLTSSDYMPTGERRRRRRKDEVLLLPENLKSLLRDEHGEEEDGAVGEHLQNLRRPDELSVLMRQMVPNQDDYPGWHGLRTNSVLAPMLFSGVFRILQNLTNNGFLIKAQQNNVLDDGHRDQVGEGMDNFMALANVLKKRRRKMNRHKYKKRLRRDRYKAKK